MTLYDQLDDGLRQLGLKVPAGLVDQLLSFMDDMLKWNKVYNLTAITRPDQVVVQHLLDSLSVNPFLTSKSIIDVGTGGGFPGIPLAMFDPEKRVTLLDSNVKKTRFLQQMVINQHLDNCTVIHSRAEDHELRYDQVICRAFASLPNIIQFAGHLVAEGGKLLAMKGQLGPEFEALAEAELDFRISAVEELEVPGLDAERRLVVLERVLT